VVNYLAVVQVQTASRMEETGHTGAQLRLFLKHAPHPDMRGIAVIDGMPLHHFDQRRGTHRQWR
jgi:hypothetical protein